jgi:hypothetical protein
MQSIIAIPAFITLGVSFLFIRWGLDIANKNETNKFFGVLVIVFAVPPFMISIAWLAAMVVGHMIVVFSA